MSSHPRSVHHQRDVLEALPHDLAGAVEHGQKKYIFLSRTPLLISCIRRKACTFFTNASNAAYAHLQARAKQCPCL